MAFGCTSRRALYGGYFLWFVQEINVCRRCGAGRVTMAAGDVGLDFEDSTAIRFLLNDPSDTN